MQAHHRVGAIGVEGCVLLKARFGVLKPSYKRRSPGLLAGAHRLDCQSDLEVALNAEADEEVVVVAARANWNAGD